MQLKCLNLNENSEIFEKKWSFKKLQLGSFWETGQNDTIIQYKNFNLITDNETEVLSQKFYDQNTEMEYVSSFIIRNKYFCDDGLIKFSLLLASNFNFFIKIIKLINYR